MSDFRKKVLVGNTVLYPEIIKQFLIPSSYFLIYYPEKEELTLFSHFGQSEQVLFEIRNVSHESAGKLAEGLGLEHVSSNNLSCIWSKNYT